MSRYIDLDKTPFVVGCDAKTDEEIWLITKNQLDELPTADVVEVKHGEWKKVSEKYPRYKCTYCNHLYNNKEYKYCPNCGAKMDGERREHGT